MTLTRVEVTRVEPAAGFDGVAVLTVYAVLLVAIPSRMVVGALGAAGTPANVVAIGCAFWWFWEALRRVEVRLTPSAVRIAGGVFGACVLASYVVAMRRPINATEASTATSGILIVTGWVGSLLLAHDGIRDLGRLRVLVRRLVFLGALLAALGLVQFATGSSLVDAINVPGLVNNTPALGVAERNGFNRPSGTAIHAIEFSVVITILLPLALVTARLQDGRGPLRRWLPVGLMAAAIPIAISRSAIVGACIGMLILLPVLPALVRRVVIGCAAIGGVLTFLAVPGLVGTLVRLFTGIEGDGSAQSRTGSYTIVWEYFLRNPLFGRGFSTFLPSHRILDNQYLVLLMDVGLVGVAAMVALVLSSVLTGFRVRRTATNQADRELGQALAASTMVGAVGFALFDGLSFPMAAGMLFLIVGISGALGRLLRDDATTGAID